MRRPCQARLPRLHPSRGRTQPETAFVLAPKNAQVEAREANELRLNSPVLILGRNALHGVCTYGFGVKAMFPSIRFGLLLLFGLSILSGCGGGGGGSSAPTSFGRVSVEISWPGRSRYVPPYANSVVCRLSVTGGPTYSLTANRSGDQSSVDDILFPQDIPVGRHTLRVTAYSELNGLGSEVAFASTLVTVEKGVTASTDISADLQTTIHHLVIDGQPLSVSVAGTLQMAAHGVDATNHVILMPAGSLTWDVFSGGQYGSVDATTGLFTPTSQGTAVVRVRELGAGKTAQANVAVTDLVTSGSLTVNVSWPGRSRYVPPYANSLVCLLTISGSESYTQTISRSGDSSSNGTVTFPQTFAPGTYALAVTAMSQTNGGGQAVASASMNITITSGQTTTRNVSADLQSTIHHLEIDGQPLTVAIPNTITIQGHADNASNATILLPQGALTWDVTAGASYGSINSVTGIYTSESPGTATVRLREVGAAKSVTASVVVTGTPQAQKIYVNDVDNGRIARMDSITGTGWQTISTGSTWGSSVAVDSAGRVYWTDEAANQVCRADASGANIVRYGAAGSGIGEFDDPIAVAVDSQNRIYVVDKYNNRVVRMDDMAGAGWTEVGGFGSGDGNLYVPEGVFVASDGTTYVADTGNCRIVQFSDMATSGWTMLGDYRGSDVGQFDNPVGVVVTTAGIFIADSMNYRIVKVADMSGTGWTTLGGPTSGSGTGQFDYPTGIAADSSGRIYVTDYLNCRLVRFSDITGAGWTTLGAIGSGANQFTGPKGVCVR
jgi:hypothetical protein